ncbi:MAG: aminotransferase class I/II-fold pyridoxal phosphate-dependent enzyme [Actinomycetia bacterium]|nr:aminotransferase class I/II-fold pyridoxal phosphate-dependent enzyme [Actinomycetes bacterium]
MRILGADLQTNRRRTSVKWQAYPPDVLPLWVAEMDALLPEQVIEEVTDLIRRGDTGYAWPQPYIEAFADFAQDLWGWSVPPSSVRTVADVMIGIEELTRVLIPEAGVVFIDDPVYDAFPLHIETIRRRLQRVPLDNHGRLDPAALEAAFAEAEQSSTPAVYWLCNPQNPLGTVPTRDELTALAEIAARHGVRVISDEIHAPLAIDPSQFVPYLSVDPRGFTVTSPSKSFSLAGLKAGLVIAGSDATEDLQRLHPVTSYAASHVAVRAHTVAYREGRDWLAQVRSELDDNRHLLRDLLTEHLPEVRWPGHQATYLAWLDVTDLRLGQTPAHTLAKKAAVALSEGRNYGPAGANRVRLNFATSPQILTEAIERIEHLVDDWRP